MEIPTDLLFTQEHEWVRVDKDDDLVTIGITDYAQNELGDVVFIDLPEVGIELTASDVLAQIESVKAASDIYCPVSGKVLEVNESLEEEPELVNSSPYEGGWIAKTSLDNETELNNLMNDEEYNEFLNGGSI